MKSRADCRWSRFASSALVIALLCALNNLLHQDPSQFISAKVENIVSYGAFFGLEDGCSGFVHISQARISPHEPTSNHVSLPNCHQLRLPQI